MSSAPSPLSLGCSLKSVGDLMRALYQNIRHKCHYEALTMDGTGRCGCDCKLLTARCVKPRIRPPLRSGEAAARSRRSGLRFSVKTRLRLQPALPRQNVWLRTTPLLRLQTLFPHSRHFPVPSLEPHCPSQAKKKNQTTFTRAGTYYSVIQHALTQTSATLRSRDCDPILADQPLSYERCLYQIRDTEYNQTLHQDNHQTLGG